MQDRQQWKTKGAFTHTVMATRLTCQVDCRLTDFVFSTRHFLVMIVPETVSTQKGAFMPASDYFTISSQHTCRCWWQRQFWSHSTIGISLYDCPHPYTPHYPTSAVFSPAHNIWCPVSQSKQLHFVVYAQLYCTSMEHVASISFQSWPIISGHKHTHSM